MTDAYTTLRSTGRTRTSSRSIGDCRLAGVLLITAVICASIPWPSMAADRVHPWAGDWQVMWRQGSVFMHLEQNGDDVTGYLEPLGGLLSGRVADGVLRMEWSRDEHLVSIVCILANDGRTFTGRYAKTEFFNGERAEKVTEDERDLAWLTTPRESLRALTNAFNKVLYSGDAASQLVVTRLLLFEGDQTNVRQEVRRRGLLWRLLNMSTFRLFDAPVSSIEAGDADFRIGPAGSSERYTIRFRADDGIWKVVVESEAALASVEQRFLEDLELASYEQYLAARSMGPRQTMRQFVQGVNEWQQGGKERALATLDLSFMPDHLHDIEGPILADYLNQIIDRAGYLIWQEIPDDPGQPLPYFHYRHPAGAVVIERKTGVEGQADQWLFSAETLRNAPRLLVAMEGMPIANGVGEARPFTQFFALREWIRAAFPILVNRTGNLENWQWLALAISLVFAIGAARIAGWLITIITLRLKSDDSKFARINFDWPVRITVAGLVLFLASAILGLADGGLILFGRFAAVIVTVGLGFTAYQVASVLGAYFLKGAEKTVSYVDEIVATLATALVKLLIVIFTVIACADITSLPYEGVIAGLGIGGLALAFASRETLSNMLGAIILLADRPFKRGDLVEAEGTFATVETVGLRSTRLRTFDDSLMIIPNASLSDKSIVNWGKRRRRRVLLQIGLEYSTPREKLDRFVRGLHDIYEAQPRADKSEHYVGLTGFGPSSLDIELWGYFKVYAYGAHVEAQHALVGDIIDWARQVGVSFAFPTRTLHITPSSDEVPKANPQSEHSPMSQR